jgi:hypothetical protein
MTAAKPQTLQLGKSKRVDFDQDQFNNVSNNDSLFAKDQGINESVSIQGSKPLS